MTIRPSVKKILKGIFQTEGKDRHTREVTETNNARTNNRKGRSEKILQKSTKWQELILIFH